MLWVSVLLPDLPLEVFLRGSAPDAALRFGVTTGGHSPRVVTANAAACAAGVAPGQLVSAALALAPDLVLRERDASLEAAALAGLATLLAQFTPMVSLAPPQALLAEIGASVRLFGGLPALLQHIATSVREAGYRAALAAAPTPGAARFLARAGQARAFTRMETLERVLAALPLAALDADPAAVRLLHGAGVATFGAACALPRAALARRVGAAFVDLLDRVRGRQPDPQLPYVAPARYRGRIELAVPVHDVEALGFAVKRLVHELAGWLLGRGLGVMTLALSLEHERYVRERTGTAASTLRLALASPAREAAHLTAVLRERLARLELPAPVEAVVLESMATAHLPGRNLGLLPGDDAVPAVPLLDRLRARLGDDAVIRVAPCAEHRPERAWRADEQPAAPVAERATARLKVPMPDNPVPENPVPDGSLPDAPRPLWLLREPQPLAATFEQKPWVLRDGPERIESGWWDGHDVRRDYYVAESPRGEVLWIYRDAVPGADTPWFLHGIFA